MQLILSLYISWLIFWSSFYSSSSYPNNQPEKSMGGRKARFFVHNSNVVLVVIIIFEGDAIFAKFHNKLHKFVKLYISTYIYIYIYMVCCFSRRLLF